MRTFKLNVIDPEGKPRVANVEAATYGAAMEKAARKGYRVEGIADASGDQQADDLIAGVMAGLTATQASAPAPEVRKQRLGDSAVIAPVAEYLPTPEPPPPPRYFGMAFCASILQVGGGMMLAAAGLWLVAGLSFAISGNDVPWYPGRSSTVFLGVLFVCVSGVMYAATGAAVYGFGSLLTAQRDIAINSHIQCNLLREQATN